MTIQEIIDLLQTVEDKSAPGRLINADGEAYDFTGDIDSYSEETVWIEVK